MPSNKGQTLCPHPSGRAGMILSNRFENQNNGFDSQRGQCRRASRIGSTQSPDRTLNAFMLPPSSQYAQP